MIYEIAAISDVVIIFSESMQHKFSENLQQNFGEVCVTCWCFSSTPRFISLSGNCIFYSLPATSQHWNYVLLNQCSLVIIFVPLIFELLQSFVCWARMISTVKWLWSSAFTPRWLQFIHRIEFVTRQVMKSENGNTSLTFILEEREDLHFSVNKILQKDICEAEQEHCSLLFSPPWHSLSIQFFA